jgi:hypothetical protein
MKSKFKPLSEKGEQLIKKTPFQNFAIVNENGKTYIKNENVLEMELMGNIMNFSYKNKSLIVRIDEHISDTHFILFCENPSKAEEILDFFFNELEIVEGCDIYDLLLIVFFGRFGLHLCKVRIVWGLYHRNFSIEINVKKANPIN